LFVCYMSVMCLLRVIPPEMVAKILDRGIFWEYPQAYFRVGWKMYVTVLM
jgi:hypothetical protein